MLCFNEEINEKEVRFITKEGNSHRGKMPLYLLFREMKV